MFVRLFVLQCAAAMLQMSQHTALMAIYNTSGCGACKRFAANEPCSSDVRVACSATGDVTFLDLGQDSLSGTIDTRIGLLTALTVLRFHDNLNLTGTVPTELLQLRALRELKLDNTRLTGSMPAVGAEICSALLTCVSCGAAPVCSCSAAMPASCITLPRVVPMSLMRVSGPAPMRSTAAPTPAVGAPPTSVQLSEPASATTASSLVVAVDSSTGNSNSGNGINTTALVGGVVGGVLGFALLAGVVVLVMRVRHKRAAAGAGANDDEARARQSYNRPPAEASYAQPDAPYKNRKYADVGDVRSPVF